MKSHAVSVAEPGWLRRWWERFSDYAIVVLGLAAIAGLVFGLFGILSAKDSSRAAAAYGKAAAKSSATAAVYAKRLNSFQHAAHKQSIAYQRQITQLLSELTDEAAAIEYEGGVITYLSAENGQKDDEILAAQAQGHALLLAVAGLQAEINQDVPELKLGLNNGQAQINDYLHYLTCLGTNPTNASVCGAAPPLPTT